MFANAHTATFTSHKVNAIGFHQRAAWRGDAMQTIATSNYQLLRELSTTRPETLYVDNPFTDQLEQAE
jgi:hypothetical protein